MNEKNEMINHPGQWLFEEGRAYDIGLDFKKEDKKRGQLMTEASASAGFPMAVAYCHFMGWNGLKQDKKKAFDEFVKIEKDMNGHHWSQFMIGVCYKNGYGTEKDLTKAVEWYTKSVEKGNSLAMNNLGFCYDNGVAGVDEDETKAFELYEQSALLGNSYGMYNLGYCYKNGWGVTKDINKTKEWYAKAAAQGHATAQTNLDKLKAG